MKKADLKKINLPKKPGVYFFLNKGKLLYVGKATNLNDRVKSYFSKDLINSRGPGILDMVAQASSIDFKETDSVLEALILESNLIKKYQPKYNTKEKDNKSFNYVCITNDEIPMVLIERGRSIDHKLKKIKYKNIFGPFPSGATLKEAMKIVRRIFPFIDEQSSKKNNIEFYRQLGLVPEIIGVSKKNNFQKAFRYSSQKSFSKMESQSDRFEKEFSATLLAYKKNIKNLKLFFQGKKKDVINNLKREMMFLAKKKEFERAGEIKKKIFALNHINDIALIKEENKNYFANKESHFRIEAYDIAHMNGKDMVGVMVVLENGELSKNEYRKFVVKTVDKPDDNKALAEILERRFAHKEWRIPNLIVVDGGAAQLNRANLILKNNNIFAPVVSVVKNEKHKPKALMGDELVIKKNKKEILLANATAHDFAIGFHKQKRNKNFINL